MFSNVMTHSSESMTFIIYNKDFMNLYCTFCILLKYVIHITTEICKEKNWLMKGTD